MTAPRTRWEPQRIEGTDVYLVDLLIRECPWCDSRVMATLVLNVGGFEWVDNPTPYPFDGDGWVLNMKVEGSPDRLLVAQGDGLVRLHDS